MDSRAWLRRALTLPSVFLAWFLVTTTSPLLLSVALAIDLLRAVMAGRPWMATRLTLAAWAYLTAEVGGVLVLAAAWLLAGVGPGRQARLLRMTYFIQGLWAAALFHTVRRLLGLRIRLDGDADAVPGPVLVFVNHTSIIDTLLPTMFLTRRRGLRLRFVMKQELLVSPCLDIAGHWLPNTFIHRSGDRQEQVERIRALGRALGPSSGVLLYPEGTRFTPRRLARALERIREYEPDRLKRAGTLRHVLPPRVNGVIALLDAAPDSDIVFLAHVGLERLTFFHDLWRGDVLGTEIRLQLRRVRRAEVPGNTDERVAWLDAQWQRTDHWIDVQMSQGTV